MKSPHIVDVYDSGRLEDGRPFIVMEMLDGESLYDRMARDRLISLQDTVKIVTDCAKGLLKAHSASIVHRDLKPENIFIIRGEDGQELCKLLDFGLAKFYAPLVGDEKQNRLTREGAVFGTPRVHVSGAGQRPGQRRPPLRSLGAWLHGVRVPHRTPRVEHGTKASR